MDILTCKVNKKCGGCQLLNLTYEEQLEYKKRQLNNLLSKFGKVEGITGMSYPYYYRNKVQSAFFWDYKRRRSACGVYQSGSGKVIQTDSCLLENQKASMIIKTVRELTDSFKIKPFDKRYGTGILRHVLVRVGKNSGEIMVVLVTATPALPSKNNFVKALLKAHPEITTVIQNINNNPLALTLSSRSSVLFGKGYIEDELCGMRFKISAESFYQVNTEMCEKLYEKAIELAGLTGEETVFDSYCGTGTIGLIASKNAKQVLGVELNKKAVNDAASNAKINAAKNVFFLCGDAGEIINELADNEEKFDVVFMDPPRAGSSREFLKALTKIKAKRIIYISCNPVTLARDLDYLTKKYKVKAMQGFDMFPHTKHCEAIVSLEIK